MQDKGSTSIFRGPAVEADTVHDYLAQNGIGALVRNHMQENLDAGWLTAAPDHAAEVFVAREDEAKAKDLMLNLFHENGDIAATAGNTNSTPPTTGSDEMPVPPPSKPPLP